MLSIGVLGTYFLASEVKADRKATVWWNNTATNQADSCG